MSLATQVKKIKDWRFVFNPQQPASHFYRDMFEAGNDGSKAGYRYMAWNDRIYELICFVNGCHVPTNWKDTGFVVKNGKIVEE